MLNIVLFRPEIPQNTGNIGRTCVLMGARLHIIGPTGFTINDVTAARAGLDYWKEVDLYHYGSYEELRAQHPKARFFFSSTKGTTRYCDVSFEDGDFIVFGRESSGLPEHIMKENVEYLFRVPMLETTSRSLNLANTVAIVAFEVLRQWNFPGMR